MMDECYVRKKTLHGRKSDVKHSFGCNQCRFYIRWDFFSACCWLRFTSCWPNNSPESKETAIQIKMYNLWTLVKSSANKIWSGANFSFLKIVSVYKIHFRDWIFEQFRDSLFSRMCWELILQQEKTAGFIDCCIDAFAHHGLIYHISSFLHFYIRENKFSRKWVHVKT